MTDLEGKQIRVGIVGTSCIGKVSKSQLAYLNKYV